MTTNEKNLPGFSEAENRLIDRIARTRVEAANRGENPETVARRCFPNISIRIHAAASAVGASVIEGIPPTMIED